MSLCPSSRLVGVAAVALCLAANASAQFLMKNFFGTATEDLYGQVVCIVGDMNGDGKAEVAVTALKADPGGFTNAGSVFVYSGADWNLLYRFDGTFANENYGYSLDAAGDVDADGRADLIIGTEFGNALGIGTGLAHVVSGASGQIIRTFIGQHANDRLGNAVGGAGDVNADGYDDLIVGANKTDVGGTDTGSAIVFSGYDGSILWTFDGIGAGDQFGEDVGAAGDVDGDGHADVLAGSNYNDVGASNAGMTRLFSGATGQAIYTWYGANANDFQGVSVAGVGDASGDGVSDILVGIAGSDIGGSNAGAIKLFSGATGQLVYARYGSAGGDLFGRYVDAAGDIDGDGFGDFIAGMQLSDGGGTNSGGVRAFSGITGAIIGSFYGLHAGDEMGERVSGTGDVDGDGFPDVIVGSAVDDTVAVNAGSAQVLTFCGAATYGFVPTNPTQKLIARFTHGPAGARTQGTFTVEDGLPFASMLIGVATAPGNSIAIGVPIVIDTASPNLLLVSASLSPSGSAAYPLNLRQPAIAGSTFFTQVVSVDPVLTQGWAASNGLRLVFCP